MGCGSSRDAQSEAIRLRPQGRQQPSRIGPPQGVQIHIPRNRADAQGVPIPMTVVDIDRSTLRRALDHVSDYVSRRGRDLTVIAVGGAVNTLYLQSRGVTHDVDIFGTNLGNASRVLLDEALQYAAQQVQEPLGTHWFNTDTQQWMNPRLHQQLTNESIEQDAVVYRGQGLTILAAPWEYAFSAKLNRLLSESNVEQRRPYDLSDAVSYLHQYIRQHGDRPVPVQTCQAWAQSFGHATNASFLLRDVNAAYKQQYQSTGICR